MPEYVVLDKDLVRGLSEKEVEIEHLKSQITALNEKIVVISELKRETEQSKELWRQSELKRDELQTHIREVIVTVKEDREEHEAY